MAKWVVDGQLRQCPTTVEITTRQGKFSHSTDYARGDPWVEEYAATNEELETKFRELAAAAGIGRVKEAGKAETVISLIRRLEEVADINQLLSALSA